MSREINYPRKVIASEFEKKLAHLHREKLANSSTFDEFVDGLKSFHSDPRLQDFINSPYCKNRFLRDVMNVFYWRWRDKRIKKNLLDSVLKFIQETYDLEFDREEAKVVYHAQQRAQARAEQEMELKKRNTERWIENLWAGFLAVLVPVIALTIFIFLVSCLESC